MRLAPAAPSVDLQNPLYCPAVPAASYLDNLRTQPSRVQTKVCATRRSRIKIDPKVAVSSFSRLLGKALQNGKETPKAMRKTRSQTADIKIELPKDDDALIQLPWDVSGSSSSSSLASSISRPRPVPNIHNRSRRPHLKRKPSFDLLHRPAKHAKSLSISFDEPDEEPFYVPLDFSKTATFDFSPPATTKITIPQTVEEKLVDRIKTLEDTLYGPSIGTESPRGLSIFIDRLAELLPGIRLKERLSALPTKCHQGVADYLGEHGLLNARVMAMLRTSEIRYLSLSNSLEDEDGLNIEGGDILKVFIQPNSFVFLTQLSLSGTRIYDFDLVHIQRLPRLSILLLDNTGISNEAVYILTSLKRTLTHLTIATNPDINNDAIPALLLLTKLSFLSLLETDINIVGLRRLAEAIYTKRWIIDVEIPDVCERYLSNLETKYLVKIGPPLIIRASLCEHLSAAALKRNLAAHAACNPDILAEGTKQEMKERLEILLLTRELDLLTADMVFGP